MADSEDGAHAEYDEKAAELTQQAKETKDAQEEAHAAMLDAVAEGDEFQIEDYEWVELGSAELKVKTWLPGNVVDDVAEVEEMAAKEAPGATKQSIETNLRLLASQTEVVRAAGETWDTPEQVKSFYRGVYDRFGPSGLARAVTAVTQPVEDTARRDDVMQSFRST